MLVILVSIIILVPRIPLMPVGFGDLSVRIDGVTSALAGLLTIYILRLRIALISLILLGFLYSRHLAIFAISIGLFLQILSIITLPILLSQFKRNDIKFEASLLSHAEIMIIWYSILNITIAFSSRIFTFEVCADSLTSTGCIGTYGLLDRPYVFSIFIGAAFVFLCASKNFTFLKAAVLLYGLVISDSRSIAAIMFLLGVFVFFKNQKLSYRNLLPLIIMVLFLIIILSLGEGKMSLSSSSSNEPDPSWLMRLDSINNYFDWVDIPKLILGDGALAFYQFSEQYGIPGPIDNLYFRVASEIGIFGGFIFMLLILHPLAQSAKKHGNIFILLIYIFATAIISIFQESLITPRAGHVLIILGIYLASKNFEKPQEKLTPTFTSN